MQSVPAEQFFPLPHRAGVLNESAQPLSAPPPQSTSVSVPSW
jgi:hypothetical protein